MTANTPSRLSGIRFDDKICMYALVSQSEVRCHLVTTSRQLESDIKKAHKDKKSVLFLVERSMSRGLHTNT